MSPQYDGVELMRWADTYGHPEEWAKRAQDAHAKFERVEQERDRLRAQLEEIAALADRSDFKRVGQMARALDDIYACALAALTEQELS